MMSLLRRMMMTTLEGEEEMKQWSALENTILEEASSWNKAYEEGYEEYIIHITIPKVETALTTGASMIFGTGVIYYVSVGNSIYSTDIVVSLKKILDDTWMADAIVNPNTGINAFGNLGRKIMNNFKTSIIIRCELPIGTTIRVYAR